MYGREKNESVTGGGTNPDLLASRNLNSGVNNSQVNLKNLTPQ